MLLETFDTGLEARTLQILFALTLGVIFGVAAQISRFCLRRAVAGDTAERGPAGAVWLTALATALIGFQIAQGAGFIALEDHRWLSPDIPVLAIILGGLAFGVGMVLTRGCASRLTVLAASGNLRAVTVLILFAITAHATLKGVLAPVRVTLGEVTATLPFGSLAEMPLGAPLAMALALCAAAFLIRRVRPRPLHVAMGVLIGLIPVLGWAGTSVLLFDEFDPLAVQSAAFTLPLSDTLFWIIASSAIPAGFGTGLIAGVLLGGFLSATARGELSLQSFETGLQTLRYALGGVLMGFGGVLAGGCTVGAGLSGAAALSVSALLALAAIATGGAATGWALNRTPQPALA